MARLCRLIEAGRGECMVVPCAASLSVLEAALQDGYVCRCAAADAALAKDLQAGMRALKGAPTSASELHKCLLLLWYSAWEYPDNDKNVDEFEVSVVSLSVESAL